MTGADEIGLQWLLDPTTDVNATVETYINRTVAAWRSNPDRTREADVVGDLAAFDWVTTTLGELDGGVD